MKTLFEQLGTNMWLIPQKVENVTAYLKQEDLDKQMGNICLNGKKLFSLILTFTIFTIFTIL